MAVSLLRRFLNVWDPIFCGFTAKGIADAMPALGGWGFARRAGGYNLYRGEGATPTVNYDLAVGAASASQSQIANFPTYPYSVSTIHWLGIRAISPGGAEEANTDRVLRIETDADGVPLGLVPNPPVNLAVYPRAGGIFVIAWEHDPRREQTPPASWRVYHDNGTGTMNWTTPIATVTGTGYVTGAYADETTVKFGARALSAADVEETNTNVVSAVADAAGPADIGAPVISEGAES